MAEQLSLFDQRPVTRCQPSTGDTFYRPLAFYSAVDGEGKRLHCWRCKNVINRQDLAEHSRDCWPEVVETEIPYAGSSIGEIKLKRT